MNNEFIFRVLQTDNSWSTLIIRITLGGVLFPHVMQKLFAAFGGPGLSGEMSFMKEVVGLPGFVAVAAITIECAGTLMILTGFGTRIAALGIMGLFIGMIAVVHFENGFFMNWFSKLPSGKEGFEFHLLVLGMCIVLLYGGGGKWSVDSLFFSLPRQLASLPFA